MLRVLACILGAPIAATMLAHVLLYAHAARHRPFCPLDDEDVPPWPARVLAWTRLLVAECSARLLLAATWPLDLLASRAVPTRKRPVVLVHGYATPRGSMRWLGRRLRHDGHPAHAVRLRTVWTDLERSATRLADAIDRVRRAAGAADVDVVAHGIAGLVVRALLRRRPHGVHRVVTLGTPHQGTLALRWLAFDRLIDAAQPGSPALRALATNDPVPATTDFIAIHSVDDALIVPSTNGYYPGAFNLEIAGCGHAMLLLSSRVYELVRENLAADDAPVAATPR